MLEKNRLLLIGLDGATWDVLNPLLEENKLPNLKRIKENGISGVLESNFPPITGSAWMTIATGKEPGETGIFDFLNIVDRKSWQIKAVSSFDYRNNGSIWDFLSAKGKKVGVVNYPMLYPPYEVNGVLISGLGADEKGDIFYPKNLKQKLKSKLGPHKIYTSFGRPRYKNPENFISDLSKLIEYNHRLADFLLNDTYDFFFFVISATDFLQHYAWNWWTNKNSKYHEVFIRLWQKIDDVVGSMLKKWGNNNVMVVSDHGMGELKDRFLINRWLQEEGYLFLKGKKGGYHNYLRGVKYYLREGFNLFAEIFPTLGDALFWKILRKKVKKFYFPSQNIDFEKSKAFALKHSGLGNIYINIEDENGREYLRLRDEIKNRLKAFLKSVGLKSEIYSKDELYKGDKINKLPDLIFMIEDNMTEVISAVEHNKMFISPKINNKTGSHRIEGIYIAKGPNIEKVRDILNGKCKLKDIFPACCVIMGEGSPKEFATNQQRNSYEQSENDKIIEKLEGLGYM